MTFTASLVNNQNQVATYIVFKILHQAFWYCAKCQAQQNFVATKAETSIYKKCIILFAVPK